MAERSRFSLFTAVVFVMAGVLSGWGLVAAGSGSRFAAAYFRQVGAGDAVLTVFPLGSEAARDAALPTGLATFNLISFAADGRSAYLQEPSAAVLSRSDALVKVDFDPMRRAPVPGSGGMGEISSLTVSPGSGHIFVSASGGADRLCGAYEIDPESRTHRPLRVGNGPQCGGGMGSVSPDGTQLLATDGGYLSLLNLETGERRPLGAGAGSWSPDGRRIAASVRGRILLIDVRNPSLRKDLGMAGIDNRLIWSPDSKLLLFAKREMRCSFLHLFQVDDAESLKVVDVETGKRNTIQSARCAVTSSAVGWIDQEAIR